MGCRIKNGEFMGDFSLLFRMEQTCKTFPALRAGDMPVSVGNDHRIHDILFPYLHHIEIAAKRFILRRKLLHTGKRHRVSDHRGLGDAGLHLHGVINPVFFHLVVILVHRVGMVGLHPEIRGSSSMISSFFILMNPDMIAVMLPALPIGTKRALFFIFQRYSWATS